MAVTQPELSLITKMFTNTIFYNKRKESIQLILRKNTTKTVVNTQYRLNDHSTNDFYHQEDQHDLISFKRPQKSEFEPKYKEIGA